MLRQEEVPLIKFIDTKDNSKYASINVFSLWEYKCRPVFSFSDYTTNKDFHIRASCDGLIVLELADNSFYICNPATLQWLELDNLKGKHFGGLYLHPSINKYCIIFCQQGRNTYWEYHVLEVGSHKSRRLRQPVDSSSSSAKQGIKLGLPIDESNQPVQLHNCLHWKKQEQLLIFNTGTESFSCIPLTDAEDAHIFHKDAHLLQVDDTLGMGYVGEDMAKLWLQDYNTNKWILKYRITLPIKEISSFGGLDRIVGKFGSKYGDVLINGLDNSRHLIHCDKNGKVVNEIKLSEGYVKFTGYTFKESHAKHMFFKMQGGRLMEPMPPFFEGFTTAAVCMGAWSSRRSRPSESPTTRRNLEWAVLIIQKRSLNSRFFCCKVNTHTVF